MSAPAALRQAGQRLDVGDLGDRIRRALEDHQARRMRGQRPLDAGDVLDRDHGVRHPEPAEQAADEIARRIVGLDEAQDVIALLRQRQQRLRDRADARGGHQALFTPLQLRQQQLQLPRGGIRGPRVEKTGPLTAEETLRLLQRVELELDASGRSAPPPHGCRRAARPPADD